MEGASSLVAVNYARCVTGSWYPSSPTLSLPLLHKVLRKKQMKSQNLLWNDGGMTQRWLYKGVYYIILYYRHTHTQANYLNAFCSTWSVPVPICLGLATGIQSLLLFATLGTCSSAQRLCLGFHAVIHSSDREKPPEISCDFWILKVLHPVVCM